jgi:predicted metal-dependent phosphoesterase TrpH
MDSKRIKIDIHCHTAKYSPCSEQPAEDMIEAGIRRGLDGIVITEHNLLWKKEALLKLQEKYPDILILNGVELTVSTYPSSGYDTYDILLYGLPQDYEIPPGRLTVEKTFDMFEPEGCAFVLAHPFRFSQTMKISDDTLRRFHAIEIDSSNFTSHTSTLSMALSERLNIAGTTASDSHSTKTTGLWYIETPRISTMEEFVQVLRKRQWKTKEGILQTEEGLEENKKMKEVRIEKLQKAEKILKACNTKKSAKPWWKFW